MNPNVREANEFLVNVKKYNTPDSPLNPGALKHRIGEVYFLSGYLYWLLVRNWGACVYLAHPVNPNAKTDFKRESVQTVVKDIVADADSAYARVPARWTGKNFGRIDKGAALGLKAVALYTAATPLWNGGKLPNDTRPHKSDYTYHQDRWVKAKKAAKALIDYKVDGQKRYTLYTKYGKDDFDNDLGINGNNSKVYKRLWELWYDMDAFKHEFVLFFNRDKSSLWQGDVYPPSLGGSARQMPSQEQVDEYGCIGSDGFGYPIWMDKDKTGYNDANPYTSCKRDPRFYADIIYMGSEFHSQIINTAKGPDKIGASSATTTGYYLRKFFKAGWNHNYYFAISSPPVWRLPQFIYMYAEAVDRLQGPTQEIYNMINKVRAASFMAPERPAILNSKKLMMQAIQREWRVEFFHGNHYYWHLRQEMIPTSDSVKAREQAFRASGSTPAERAENFWPYPQTQKRLHGMKPVKDPKGKIVVDGVHYRMQRFLVKKTVFSAPQSYLFPILNSELERDPNLVQNPGW
jgi:hypothetical protein